MDVSISEVEVKNFLKVDEKKAVDPNNINLCLRQCADELEGPFATIFSSCLWTNTEQKKWKYVMQTSA